MSLGPMVISWILQEQWPSEVAVLVETLLIHDILKVECPPQPPPLEAIDARQSCSNTSGGELQEVEAPKFAKNWSNGSHF